MQAQSFSSRRGQLVHLVAHIGKRGLGRQPLCLDFEDGDFVEQLAPRHRHGGIHIGLLDCITVWSARAISENTLSQSPAVVCRKRRIVGYHGVCSPASIQRQSGTRLSATQIGTPSAPARWGVAVSDVTTRSRFCMIAAVSTKASPPSSKEPSVSTFMSGGSCVSCSSPCVF